MPKASKQSKLPSNPDEIPLVPSAARGEVLVALTKAREDAVASWHEVAAQDRLLRAARKVALQRTTHYMNLWAEYNGQLKLFQD